LLTHSKSRGAERNKIVVVIALPAIVVALSVQQKNNRATKSFGGAFTIF